MICNQIQLKDRKYAYKKVKSTSKRYCQQRLVDDNFEKYSAWNFDQFDDSCIDSGEIFQDECSNSDKEDIYLSVITLSLPFQKLSNPQRKLVTECFSANRTKNRMFIKKKQETCLEFDGDSLPEDTLSSVSKYSDYVHQNIEVNSESENQKATIYDDESHNTDKNYLNDVVFIKSPEIEDTTTDKNKTEKGHKNNSSKLFSRRLSLIASKPQSPDIEQIIRVDVVCTYASESTSSDDEKEDDKNGIILTSKVKVENSKTKVTHDKSKMEEAISLDVEKKESISLLCKALKLHPRRTEN